MKDQDSWDRFEQLLAEHPFYELSQAEREWVLSFVNSEEEYNALRLVEGGLSKLKVVDDLVPDPAILKVIQASTRQPVNSFAWTSIWRYRMPAYVGYSLAIICVALLIRTLQNQSPAKVTGERIISRIDTVFVAAKSDTVYIEKVVYRNRTAPVVQVVKMDKVDPKEEDGINMKEKEELQGLLVSGSE